MARSKEFEVNTVLRKAMGKIATPRSSPAWISSLYMSEVGPTIVLAERGAAILPFSRCKSRNTPK
jgi:hypothetical protein